jgi:hypothetical protein
MAPGRHIRNRHRRLPDGPAVENHLRPGRPRHDLQRGRSCGGRRRGSRRVRRDGLSPRRNTPHSSGDPGWLRLWGRFRGALRPLPRTCLNTVRRTRRAGRRRHDRLRVQFHRVLNGRLAERLSARRAGRCSGILCRGRSDGGRTFPGPISARKADPDADHKRGGRRQPDAHAAARAWLLDRCGKQCRFAHGIGRLWPAKATLRRRRRRIRLPQRKINERIVWRRV